MLFVSKSQLDKYVDSRLAEVLPKLIVKELRKGSHYIMVVPEGINTDTLKDNFDVLSNTGVNIIVLVANDVSLLEIT